MGYYDTAEWNVARRQALHDGGHACARCGTSLIGLGKEAHVHHRKELKKAPALRSEPLNLLPLCRTCHTIEHKRKRRSACDEHGRPLDPNHPWFRATQP
jgi:predicted HNH restriction endonuclease